MSRTALCVGLGATAITVGLSCWCPPDAPTMPPCPTPVTSVQWRTAHERVWLREEPDGWVSIRVEHEGMDVGEIMRFSPYQREFHAVDGAPPPGWRSR